jgi:hypothetical protein
MYESPIKIIHSDLEMQLEGEIIKAVQRECITVDRDELIRALRYEREQYQKGFDDARKDAMPVVRCKDCKYSTLPSELTQRYGKAGTLTCHNKYSPCNRRNVSENDFCSYGEERVNG